MEIEGEHRIPDQQMEGRVAQSVAAAAAAAMTDQSMSCERAIEENCSVAVEIPRSWEERLADAFAVFCLLIIVTIFLSGVWLILTLIACLLPPAVSLEDVNIRDMVVYQNATDTAYQVRSEFNVNLKAWNPNELPKCYTTFTTFRRMVVTVEFKGQQIVRQEVPLGIRVKPRKSRTMILDLRGDEYPLKKELALLLDLELRKASGMELTFFFESRVRNSFRKARWIRKTCEAIIRTPPNGTFSQTNSSRGLAWSMCDCELIAMKGSKP